MRNFDRLTNINSKLYELGAQVRLLSRVAWPKDHQLEFLGGYDKGKTSTTFNLTYQKLDQTALRSELVALKGTFTANDPLENMTQRTIASFIDMVDLTDAIGSKEFGVQSKRIFGTPGDLIPGSHLTHLEVAKKILDIANEFTPPTLGPIKDEVSAIEVKAYLEKRIKGVFKDRPLEVNLVEGLAAKATATSTQIKLRAGNGFNSYDFKQLFYHEVMVHSLTSINGEMQPILKCLGRSSLRCLKTQEGLATFSELITGAMDLQRLKRLALRVVGIDMALQGANFVELFEFFLSHGQDQVECYNSAQRIFRGGYPDKNIIFTKDVIYLQGLLNVHTFFRWAMKCNKMNLGHLLFCGKLSLSDVFELEEAYHYQWIAPPKYLPAWFSKISGLAGSLAFSLIANLIRLEVSDEKLDWAA